MSRELLAEQLLTFVPLVYKKLTRGMTTCGISKQQLSLLFNVCLDGGHPMKYYGEKIMVSKPNMTVLADKLIEDGLIERAAHPEDRRVIILRATPKGKNELKQQYEKIKVEMVSRLSVFQDEDIQRLTGLFQGLQDIFERMQDSSFEKDVCAFDELE